MSRKFGVARSEVMHPKYFPRAVLSRNVPSGHSDLRAFRAEQQSLSFEREVDYESDYNLMLVDKNIASFFDSVATQNRSEAQGLLVPSPMHNMRFEGDYYYRARGVLVVEDSLTQRKIICRSLSQLGLKMEEKWIFFEASTGEKALHIWNDVLIDLVFMDQNLSSEGLTGSDVIKRVKSDDKHKKKTRVLVVGVISNPAAHTESLVAAGADLVYGKPLGNDEMAMRSLCGAIRHMSLC